MNTFGRFLFLLCVHSLLFPEVAPARSGVPSPVGSAADGLSTALRASGPPGRIAREDGFSYAVDGATMWIAAAAAGDRRLFDEIRAGMEGYVVSVDVAGRIRRTVSWRLGRRGEKDATGTTEILLSVEALVAGARRFGDEELLREATDLADGYAMHEDGVGRTWRVRNYYNYGTGAFSPNSYTLGYAPDLLDELAASAGDPGKGDLLRGLAARSRAFVLEAFLPNGLFHSSFDPELHSLFGGCLPSFHFSPNFIVKPGDSAAIALGIARSVPEAARRTLAFIAARWPDIGDAIYGDTGERAFVDRGCDRMSAGHMAIVLRLALACGDRNFAERVLLDVLPEARRLEREAKNGGAWIWDAATVLLALREYLEITGK